MWLVVDPTLNERNPRAELVGAVVIEEECLQNLRADKMSDLAVVSGHDSPDSRDYWRFSSSETLDRAITAFCKVTQSGIESCSI